MIVIMLWFLFVAEVSITWKIWAFIMYLLSAGFQITAAVNKGK